MVRCEPEQAVANLLRGELLDTPLVCGDETKPQVLKEPGRTAQGKSYMWGQMTDGSANDGTYPSVGLFNFAPRCSTKTR